MGDHYRHDASTPEVYEKGEYNAHKTAVDPTVPHTTQHVHGIEYEEGTRLHRGLKARQITMIAIGGAIGTGLIIGTGSALARAGPGSIFISYTFIGFIVFLVMAALGEMAAWLPLSSGFTGYATRFCDPALGFALGWTYWFKYIIIVSNDYSMLLCLKLR
jgi:yeast amino acid transporter